MRVMDLDQATDLFFEMVDAAGTPLTGLAVSAELVKNGEAAYAAIAGTIDEIGDGTYVVHLAAADVDTLGQAMLKLAATGAATQKVPFQVARFPGEIHRIKARVSNKTEFTVETGVLEVYDDDGATSLFTLTPSEANGVRTLQPA